MKYIAVSIVFILSACAAQVTPERAAQKAEEDHFRHEVYLEQEYLADCEEYEMEECF